MRKLWSTSLLIVVSAIALTFTIVGCGGQDDDPLVGIWTDEAGVIEVEFTPDSTMLLRFLGQEEKSTYTVKDGKISAPNPETGEMNEIEYVLDGDTLRMKLEGKEQTFVRKGKGATPTPTTATGETAATTESAASMSGSDLGKAAGATWTEAMQKLNTLLASKPEAATVSTQVKQLKEEYIQKMVALGRQRAALDPSGKSDMNASLAASVSAAANEDWYSQYMETYNQYGSDAEFANLLASFNILTQYADFELLKQQSPEEAARLGIN
jgi:hypothetical protein